MSTLRGNFDFLTGHDAQLSRLGALAERYFADDPGTCLIKLRQIAELLTQMHRRYFSKGGYDPQ
jgi:type I restriction enzyme, R subunit